MSYALLQFRNIFCQQIVDISDYYNNDRTNLTTCTTAVPYGLSSYSCDLKPMQRTYSIWQVILFSLVTAVLIGGAIFTYDKITNPDGIWCVRFSPNGDEIRLRGADCMKP